MKAISEKVILEDFIAQINKEAGSHLQGVIFFGSRAKGKALPWSDFDLLIILDRRERSVIDTIYNSVMDFLLEYGVDLSLKIYSQRDFEQMMALPTPFMAEIQKTGIELWKAGKRE